MKRYLRLGLPVLAVAAALIVAGVLLATTPWSGEEAAGGTIQYRLCDTVMEGPLPQEPPSRGSIRIGGVMGPDESPSLVVEVIGEHDTQLTIDPTTAVVETGGVPDPRLQPVLDTLRVEPLDPSTAPWPYTNGVQKPSVHQEEGTFRYRFPDPASGLLVTTTYVTMTDGSIVHILGLANCRSVIERMVVFRRGEQPEVTDLTKDVHPDDEQAFKVFFDELVVEALPY